MGAGKAGRPVKTDRGTDRQRDRQTGPWPRMVCQYGSGSAASGRPLVCGDCSLRCETHSSSAMLHSLKLRPWLSGSPHLQVDSISMEHFQVLQGYIFYVASTYSKEGLAAILGPPLGMSSGGLFAARSVKSWLVDGTQPSCHPSVLRQR